MNMKEWFKENCRTTKDNKVICVHKNRVEVLSMVESEKPATKENINDFLNRNRIDINE